MIFKLKQHARRPDWTFALRIQNPHEEDYATPKSCLVNIALFTHSFWFIVPQVFKPVEKWVDMATREDPSRGYWNSIPREYGFMVDKVALHVYYGIQPGCWSSGDPVNSDHTKVYFIAWNEERRIRNDYLNPDGTFFMSANDSQSGAIDFDAIQLAKSNVPKIKFSFKDYDGEENIATCHIRESEYRRGRGMFKWVGYLMKSRVYRSLDIRFEKEVGYEKGSWKGGTMGHAIQMMPSETPLQAFSRYGSTVDYYKNHGNKSRGFTNITQIP